MEVLTSLVVASVAITVGVSVMSHQRGVGCLLVLYGVSVAVVLPPWFEPGGRAELVSDQLMAGAWVLLFLWVALIGYVVPDGRSPSRFWRWWIRVGLVGVVCFVVGAAGSDPGGFREQHGGTAPPVTALPVGASVTLSLLGLPLVVMLLLGSVAAVAQRLRGSTGDRRRQLQWVALGVVPVPVTLVLGWTSHFLLGTDGGLVLEALLTVTGVALPVCLGIAILRHRMFDIEVVLSRTLTYAVLVSGTALLHASLLLLADRALGEPGIGGVVAIAVVALTLTTVHGRVRRRIERWVHGYRSEPHLALRLIADRTEAADVVGLVDTVTATVTELLRAERVWVGGPGTGEPMVYRGERVGDLVVTMPPGSTMTAADECLLRDLARYAAPIVHAEHLHARLRRSRRTIVEGREEERRRLRRDLHDGVGPALASVLLLLGAARSRTSRADSDALVLEAAEQVRHAVREVRRAVEDLRPAAIDQVGLVDALGQRATTLSGPVAFTVESAERLPTLPAAVEVAAFRIASEAMTNVVRHSGASTCLVEISVADALEVLVSDDGTGLSAQAEPGVGWSSMSERAAELGGSCTVVGRSEGGVRVHAVLPLVSHPGPDSMSGAER